MTPARPVTELIAHRGAKREFPENTLAAFERAIERGADAIELDVHRTADGVVVVHHDPVLAATTAGALGGTPLDAMPWSQLESTEIAPGFTIPALSQVLDLVSRRAVVYVEIKGSGIEEAVAEVIRHSDAECAIHSFDHEMIVRARAVAPEIPRGILFDSWPTDLAQIVHRTGARDVWPEWHLVDTELVTRAHAIGARVLAWTVNERRIAEDLIRLGVDGLCGDDVRALG